MRNNLYHLVSVVLSNRWKGHNAADDTGEQWTPHNSPSSLATFPSVLIGPKRGERKNSFRDFTWEVSCSLARLARFYPRWTIGLMEAPTAGSDYSHIWTGRMTGNAKFGFRITIRPAKTWAIARHGCIQKDTSRPQSMTWLQSFSPNLRLPAQNLLHILRLEAEVLFFIFREDIHKNDKSELNTKEWKTSLEVWLQPCAVRISG